MLKWLRNIFHKKPDQCDGCDMAMLTSWISCDTLNMSQRWRHLAKLRKL